MNNVAQGTGNSQRIGSKITMDAIFIKGEIRNQGLDSVLIRETDPLMCRIALVLDKQCNGAAPAAPDIWETGVGKDYQDFRNLEKSNRFTVLYDKEFTIENNAIEMTPGSNYARAESRQYFHINKKFKNGLVVHFNGVGNTVGDISDNAIHLWVAVHRAGGECTFKSRLRYWD